jgi:hypothetical protein
VVVTDTNHSFLKDPKHADSVVAEMRQFLLAG